MKSLQSLCVKLTVLLIVLMCITIEIESKPMVDIYEDMDEDKLLAQMADLIDTIGADDDDQDRQQSRVTDLTAEDRCLQPVRRGVCRALIPRWMYDPVTKQCHEFTFGGCDGNGNNFVTQKQCMDICT